MIDGVKQIYLKDPREFWFKIVSIFLSSIFVPNITVLLFLSYMATCGFFSYDLFSDGIFGMNLFVMTASLVMIVIAFSLVGFGYFLIARKSNGKIEWKIASLFLTMNILMIALVTIGTINNDDWAWSTFLIIISLLIVVHGALLVSKSAKTQLISLCFFAFIVVLTVIQLPNEASRFLSIGLKTFGIGGGLRSDIELLDGSSSSGELVLISPKNIFYVPEDKSGISMIPLIQVKNLHVKKHNK